MLHPARLGAALYRLSHQPRFWAAALLLSFLAGAFWLVSPHVRAWYHLRGARTQLEHFHNAQGIRHLQVCRRIWPRDPDFLLLAARSARRARSYLEAERLLEVYQQERGLDEACSFEQLLLSAERRIDQVVEVCWLHVEQKHPETPLLLEALARGYLRQYRLEEARLCLDRWLQLYPDHPQALCLEGLFHLDYLHARSAAEASYRRAVELDPDHEEARQGLAVTLIEGKEYAEAAQHLEHLRQCQPDNLSIQVGLGECHHGLGDQEEAMRLADGVLGQNPEFLPALSLRGRVALKLGETEKAEASLRQALHGNPVDHRARYSLILCLNQNGKEEEARQQQRQLDQLEEDLARFDKIVTKEILQRPRDPALHCTLGQLLLRGGQREEGLRWLQSALRLDPQYAPARQALEDYRRKAKAESQLPDAGQSPR
jgi:tetratricopeptide (TPR) repeat protein